MARSCDNTSVGVVIRNGSGDVLLLERARFPFGLAAPAGHIDDHGSPEQAAIAEVFEEVGLYLPLSGLEKVIDARRINNQCRRMGGNHHLWTIYSAKSISDRIVASKRETKGASWYATEALQALADSTRQNIDKEARVGDQVLEPVWLDFLMELGLVVCGVNLTDV